MLPNCYIHEMHGQLKKIKCELSLRNAKKIIRALGSWLIGTITSWLQATDPEVGPGL